MARPSRRSLARLLLAVVLSVCAGVGASPSSSPNTDAVLELTAATFEPAVRAHAFIAVAFVAPWCAHCKRLEPEWAKAAETLAGGAKITLAKIDATAGENAAVAKAHDVRGFPSVRIYRDGATEASEEYEGPRVAGGIVTELERLAAPATEPLATRADVRAFVARAPVVFVGAFAEGDEEAATARGAFERAARRFAAKASDDEGHAIPHGIVATRDLLPESVRANRGASERDGDGWEVYALKTFDERVRRFDGAATAAAMAAFVEAHSTPLVAKLDRAPESRALLRRVFRHGAPKVIAFANEDAPEEWAGIERALRDVAAARPASFRFVMGDAAENDAALRYFDVAPELLPAVVLHDTELDRKYLLHEAKPGDIAGWLGKFSRGVLDPSVKSEPEPEPGEQRGAVTVVVAKTFERVVTGPDATRAVLIEFYAPWCGHCKKLAPTYEKVARAFERDADVTVAKMDAVANDVPDARFVVKGFPAIYLRVGEVIVPYAGDRSEADMVKFVRTHLGERGKSGGGGKSRHGGEL